jgi:hypothetical protein
MIHGSSGVKTKTRSIPDVTKVGTNDVFNSSDQLQSSNSTGTFTIQKRSEYIRYTTKPRSQRLKSNVCLHGRATAFYPGGIDPTRLNSINPSGWYAIYQGHHANTCNAQATALTNFKNALGVTLGSGVLGADAQGWINDAFVATRPDLTSLSIPNFLLELKDLPRLFQLWKKQLSIAKNAAGLRLNWSFGWKPLLGDLQTMVQTLSSVRQRLLEWEKTVGLVYQRTHTCLTDTIPASGNFTYPSGLHKVYFSGSVTRQVTAYLTYKTLPIGALNGVDKILKAYLDALGFELNPKIVWDAIPFSFVVDWFFDVGGWLNRFKIDTLELPVVCVDGCLQYKESLRMEHYWIRGLDGTYHNTNPRQSMTQTEEFFHRVPILPDLSACTGSGWKIPTTNQLINLISLGTVLKK